MKTTRIVVNGEPWEVPAGFGREYKRLVKLDLEQVAAGKPGQVIATVQTFLELIGFTASIEAIADWPLRKRIEAVAYAANVHLRASDNPIRRHPKLGWLSEPWRGPGGDPLTPSPTELGAT